MALVKNTFAFLRNKNIFDTRSEAISSLRKQLREGLADEVVAFIAPKIIGGRNAKTPVEGEGIELMGNAIKLKNKVVETIGEDILFSGLCSQE